LLFILFTDKLKYNCFLTHILHNIFMPPAARTTDPTSNHPPCAPGQCGKGSSDIFIEGLAAYRVTDKNTPHGVPPYCVPHSTPLAKGSTTVIFNGLPAGRVNDSHACGIIVISGSKKVMING
jgi:uncharacterized Zn-binding protein involved in type VI secretion